MTIINERAVHSDIAARLCFEQPDPGTPITVTQLPMSRYQKVRGHNAGDLLPIGNGRSPGMICGSEVVSADAKTGLLEELFRLRLASQLGHCSTRLPSTADHQALTQLTVHVTRAVH